MYLDNVPWLRKNHLLGMPGEGFACKPTLELMNGEYTFDPAEVTCKSCRRTRLFRSVKSGNPPDGYKESV